MSTRARDFLRGPATTLVLPAGLVGPIFTFGRIEGQVQAAEAQSRAALAVYQQTVLNAFRESNDASIGSQKKRRRIRGAAKRAALREYARLSRVRFDSGLASYVDVLYAENELFAAEFASVHSYSETLRGACRGVQGHRRRLGRRGRSRHRSGQAQPVPERATQQPLF